MYNNPGKNNPIKMALVYGYMKTEEKKKIHHCLQVSALSLSCGRKISAIFFFLLL